eukprot:4652125-Pyramimonas_sp.AAC.2
MVELDVHVAAYPSLLVACSARAALDEPAVELGALPPDPGHRTFGRRDRWGSPTHNKGALPRPRVP